MTDKITKFDAEETKKKALSLISFPDNKDSLLKELALEILPKIRTEEGDEFQKYKKLFRDKTTKLARIFESDCHVALMESFTDSYQNLSSDMTKNIIKDYQCSNEAEKALAELAVNAYIRVLDNSRRLNNELETREITPNRNIYIANLSKQIDRANRQFLSALMTLKQIKAPVIEMNIKAHNAFISQNQQINVDNKNNEA